MHLWEADVLATAAHEGQSDKNGVPYIEHVRAVAAGLAPFPVELQIAGVLHDVVEDTDWTLDDLRESGVPHSSLAMVDALTKIPGSTKKEQIERVISEGYAACLVKSSDNAHNSLPDRLKHLDGPTRQRLEEKYREARRMLWDCAKEFNWGSLYFEDIRSILKIVNPSLLPELEQYCEELKGDPEWTAG